MGSDRAIQVLAALAQGVDPSSGECLPEASPYNDADTIRALYTALDVLQYGMTQICISDLSKTGMVPASPLGGMKQAASGGAVIPVPASPLPLVFAGHMPAPFGVRSDAKTNRGVPDPIPEMDDRQVRLYEMLKTWRNEQARNERVPGYLVFNNATLGRIAIACPDTLAGLARVKGIGEVKLDRYSDMVLDTVNSFLEMEDDLDARGAMGAMGAVGVMDVLGPADLLEMAVG